MTFQEELRGKQEQIDQMILEYLPKGAEHAAHLVEAVNYSMQLPGKRLRPILLAESYRMFGGKERVFEPFCAAMEMIHTHSLIHDDLPALDNDDYRRGKPTTHKVFGEAMGILSGDALLNYAYETALQAFSLTAETQRVIRALKILSGRTGISGMLGGQSVDVENDGKEITEETLNYIYEKKTAALLSAPLMIGAVLAGAGEPEVLSMDKAGYSLGIAFQIQDDILDLCGTQQEIGKPVHSDEKNHKVTYISLYGLEKAKEMVRQLSEEAEGLFRMYEHSEFLAALTDSLINRRK